MFDTKIKLDFDEILSVKLSNWEKIIDNLPLHDGWAGYVEAGEDISMGALFLLSSRDTKIISSNLVGKKSVDEKLQKSIILEIVNIATGSFFSAISKRTNQILAPSLPSLAIESVKTIMEQPVIRAAANFDFEIILKSKLTFEDDCRIYFFILINSQQVNKILSSQI